MRAVFWIALGVAAGALISPVAALVERQQSFGEGEIIPRFDPWGGDRMAADCVADSMDPARGGADPDGLWRIIFKLPLPHHCRRHLQ